MPIEMFSIGYNPTLDRVDVIKVIAFATEEEAKAEFERHLKRRKELEARREELSNQIAAITNTLFKERGLS